MYGSDDVGAGGGGVSGCACPACAMARAAEQGEGGAVAPEGAGDAVLGLLSGSVWTKAALTFGFAESAEDISYNFYGEQTGFSALDETQRGAAREAVAAWDAVTALSFAEAGADADIRFGESDYAGTAYGYYPSHSEWGGDVWLKTGAFSTPTPGGYAWATLLHEIGHALGLKHGHEGALTLPFDVDSHEYSLMTYRSYVGAPGAFYSNGAWDGPQTPMMLDIAAVQTLYGANYDHRAGNDVYAIDPATGAFLVNGAVEAQPGGARVLRTIWDGGGRDIYDFSAFATDLDIDLAPGGFTDLDRGGEALRARLGPGQLAKGHVFNALLHEGDARSLIEEAVGGAGDDLILGNIADNRLSGGGGDDTLSGGLGDDTLGGGRGEDVALFAGALADYDVSRAGDDLRVTGAEGDDLIAATVEILRFADGDVSAAAIGAGADQPAATPVAEAEGSTPRTDALVRDVSAPQTIAEPGVPQGGAGADLVEGASGADTLMGGGGADTLMGGGGGDALSGGGGRDQLSGGRGGDVLMGGRGADRLEGGAGRDRLEGGAGADTFVFSPGPLDKVLDFEPGRDRLDPGDLGPLTIRDRGEDALILAGEARLLLIGVEAEGLTADDLL